MGVMKERPELTAEQRAMVGTEWKAAEAVAREFGRKCPGLADELLGAVGLAACHAALTFDPAAGASFRSYLVHRCRWACLDELRAAGLKAFRRDPDRAPRLASLDWSPDRGGGREHTAAGRSGGHAGLLDVLADDAPPPWEALEWEDAVRALTNGLPARHRDVILRMYLHADTAPLKGAGRALGVSESRACQLHTAAARWLAGDREMSLRPWPLGDGGTGRPFAPKGAPRKLRPELIRAMREALDVLDEGPAPVTAAGLSRRLPRVHPKLAAAALRALAETGEVTATAVPRGRDRPSVLYAPAELPGRPAAV